MSELVWIEVAAAEDVPPGRCVGIEVGSRYLAVYNLAGSLYATDNICTHQLAFLSEGQVDGEYIECPMHQGRFHIPTGAAQGEPVTEPIAVYPIKSENGRLFVLVPEEA